MSASSKECTSCIFYQKNTDVAFKKCITCCDYLNFIFNNPDLIEHFKQNHELEKEKKRYNDYYNYQTLYCWNYDQHKKI